MERGLRKTLVCIGDCETAEMTGLELGQYRDQQMRNTSPTKGGSRSGSPRKRSRAPEGEFEDIWTINGNVSDTDDDSDSGVDVESLTRGRLKTSGSEKAFHSLASKRTKLR